METRKGEEPFKKEKKKVQNCKRKRKHRTAYRERDSMVK
jgi:hypothetical protein